MRTAFTSRRVLILVLAVAGLIMASLAAIRFNASDLPAPKAAGGPVVVETAVSRVATIQDAVTAIGTLRAAESVMVKSEISGRIARISFSDGARVDKGDELIVFDAGIQQAQVQQARAERDLASAKLKRTQELFEKKFLSAAALDDAKASEQIAQARLALAQATLDKMTLRAPFAGVIGIRQMSVGDYIKEGADLVNIEDIRSMKADFRVPEQLSGRLRVDQTVQLESDAFPGVVFPARVAAIDAAVDQRVRNVKFMRSLKLERRQGGFQFDQTAEARQFGQAQPQQLMGFYGDQKLVEGQVSRWRFQAERITITPDGWQAERAAFTNDPFTPSQSWLDLQYVTAQNLGEGKTKIKAKRSRLILENRLPIPLRRNLTLEKEKPVDNRFVVADDGIDRSGIYFGYKLPEYDIPNTQAKLKLEPQFMVARALNGSVSTYPLPGSPAGAPNGTQTAQIGDLFGAMAKVEGKILGFATSNFAASLSTLNPSNFANGTRTWGDFSRSFQLPYLGILPAGTYTSRVYGAYRYRSFNGSLGYQDVYSAVGASLENTGKLKPWGPINHTYFWRGSFGNYQGTTFTSNSPTGTTISQTIGDSTRASFYGAVNSSLPIWTGKARSADDPKSTQNTPTPITPGLTLNTVTSTALDYYGIGLNQNLINFSGGPTLTLGSFTKNFLDYTQFTITGGGTLQQGQSPFSFDRNVDLATLGIGWTQQLFGPLLFNLGLGYNVDPSSPYFGYTTNAYGELRWQRRGYEFAIYYSPYQQVGGIRVKLNDFNFDGTGVPFVPTTLFNPTRNRQSLF